MTYMLPFGCLEPLNGRIFFGRALFPTFSTICYINSCIHFRKRKVFFSKEYDVQCLVWSFYWMDELTVLQLVFNSK